MCPVLCAVFFFNDTATTEIYTLSLHDALPISMKPIDGMEMTLISDRLIGLIDTLLLCLGQSDKAVDRKSTRLNSSHSQISYAVFCLKKKKQFYTNEPMQIFTWLLLPAWVIAGN